MKKKIIALTALASMWPIASYASGFDIPEIGVHIVQVSNASAPPQVIRRLDGYEAILPIGVATLRIARVEDPVHSGSDIRDASFRTGQQAEFYERPDPKAHE
jgi:hypothetical protein